jgi:hypothetical protein
MDAKRDHALSGAKSLRDPHLFFAGAPRPSQVGK